MTTRFTHNPTAYLLCIAQNQSLNLKSQNTTLVVSNDAQCFLEQKPCALPNSCQLGAVWVFAGSDFEGKLQSVLAD
jgi:hypothetical protein